MSKFCPECGSIIEGLDVCTCGYDVSSGKVNMKIRDKMLEKEKELNHMTNDNMINVYVDEIPKNVPAICTINQDGFVVIEAIKRLIGEEILYSKHHLEDDLKQMFLNNNLSKEEFIQTLENINDLKIEEQIKRAITCIQKL